MKRRSFLQSIVAGTITLAAAMLPYGFSRMLAPGFKPRDTNYMRPPGALANDLEFVEACIGCGLCGEVCPPRCIRFHDRDGGALVNTPFVDPTQKGCILCSKCIDVCPTNALSATPVSKVDMGIAVIDRSACYPWVDRGICGACVSVCPVGEKAIGFKMWNQYRPIVKNDCVGCGMCVEVCPHPSKPIWIIDRPLDTDAKRAG